MIDYIWRKTTMIVVVIDSCMQTGCLSAVNCELRVSKEKIIRTIKGQLTP